jgi:hypothetical protein
MKQTVLKLVTPILLSALFLLSAIGCSWGHPADPDAGLQDPPPGNPAEVVAAHARVPVVVDGELNDEVWQRSPAYKLAVTWRANAPRYPISEGGTIQFAWDDKYFYMAGRLIDLDLVAEGNRDNTLLYGVCDLLELFIKPEYGRYYWEIYGTVNDRKTTFFNPARGRNALPSKIVTLPGVITRAKARGTFNDWSDKDEGWTMEMAVPLEVLTGRGDAFMPGAKWRVLVGRYNHSAYHDVTGGELTSVPTISAPDFQLYTQWARLRIEKPAGDK